MNKEILSEKFDHCSVCESDQLSMLMNLPGLPHIGIYLSNEEQQTKYPPIDNALMYCHSCGHMQMDRAVDPTFLYTTDFQHKTSESASAKQANEFLFGFTKEIFKNNPPLLVAEIGCNDTFFLSKFVDDYKSTVIGLDPILKGKESRFLSNINEEKVKYFKVVGDFIENVNFKEQFGKAPDLIVTNFVFEHLKNPRSVVKAILNSLAESGVGVIGVPTAEFMVLNARYDQLSHQHYQQFSVNTLRLLIELCGGKVLNWKLNFTNWGQVVIAFQKSSSSIVNVNRIDSLDHDYVKRSISQFKADIHNFKLKCELLADQRKNIYGFGAAQNFPIFHYFCDKTLPFSIILDDHPLRQDKYFPYVQDIKTKKPDSYYYGDVGVLTGPDYARVLFSRMGALGFDHIVSPFSSY
jgi:cyclopropane-fatty-acyl-phospholipid synthase